MFKTTMEGQGPLTVRNKPAKATVDRNFDLPQLENSVDATSSFGALQLSSSPMTSVTASPFNASPVSDLQNFVDGLHMPNTAKGNDNDSDYKDNDNVIKDDDSTCPPTCMKIFHDSVFDDLDSAMNDVLGSAFMSPPRKIEKRKLFDESHVDSDEEVGGVRHPSVKETTWKNVTTRFPALRKI